MKLTKFRIVLETEVDTDECGDPAEWDWTLMFHPAPQETFKMVEFQNLGDREVVDETEEND